MQILTIQQNTPAAVVTTALLVIAIVTLVAAAGIAGTHAQGNDATAVFGVY